MISFEENEKLVYKVFKDNFAGYRWLKDDLLQCGRMGLWKACKKFEEDKGYKFSSYAVKVIRNEMLLYLKKETKEIACDIQEDVVSEEEVDIDMKIIYEDLMKSVKHGEMLDLFYKGMTINQLSAKYGVSKQAISKTLIECQKQLRAKVKGDDKVGKIIHSTYEEISSDVAKTFFETHLKGLKKMKFKEEARAKFKELQSE